MSEHCCKEMEFHLKAGEVSIRYSPKLRRYGILYQEKYGANSIQTISFCPWCGNRLPASLRDRWYDELEHLGIDPDDDEVPSDFLSDAWWKKQSL